MAGVVVKVDGIDGCGKSTLVERLRIELESQLQVATTREFGSIDDYLLDERRGSGTVSQVLYELALNPRLQFDDIERQLAMAVASRRQNRIVLLNRIPSSSHC